MGTRFFYRSHRNVFGQIENCPATVALVDNNGWVPRHDMYSIFESRFVIFLLLYLVSEDLDLTLFKVLKNPPQSAFRCATDRRLYDTGMNFLMLWLR